MAIPEAKQKAAAKAFAKYWEDEGYEKGESQKFWLALLRDVFGVAEPEKFITFEDQVRLDSSTGFIDGYGFPVKGFPEADCVVALKKMHQDLTAKEGN